MKIDIHITDATPEEVAMVFTGLTVAQEVGPAARLVAQKHAAKGIEKPIPDPTCDEETGCKDCDCHGLPDACDTCSPPTEKKKRGPQKGNKYGIPIELYRKDKWEYGRLWSLCKAHGLTYEQALVWKRLPSRTKGDGKQGKKMGRQPLATTPDKHDPHSSSGQKKIRELVAAKNGELRAGQTVRHNGPRASPFFGKDGKIVKIGSDGQVFVDFGKSSTWLAPNIVTVVPEVTA